MAKKYMVFTDIHGCANEFKLLLNKLPLTTDTILIFLGDYVDRGPDSKGVIDVILSLSQVYEVICLKGNHEQMFQGFLEDSDSEMAGYFIYNGGAATLASYAGEDGKYQIPEEHIEFIKNLKPFHQTRDYFFVHAGVPDKPLNKISVEDDEMDLLWIRNPFFDSDFQWGKTIVHGHTPIKGPLLTERRINIDTGCIYDNLLSAISLPEKKVYSVQKQQEKKQIHLRDQSSNRKAVRFIGAIPVYIQVDEKFLQFETQDYSPVGMLLKNIISPNEIVLTPQQEVQGEIGKDNHQTVKFEGKVVRIVEINDEHHYAIEITSLSSDSF